MIDLLLKRKTENIFYQIWDFYSDLLVEKLINKLDERENSLTTIEVECSSRIKEEDELLSIQKVCNLLGVKRGTLNNWRKIKYLVPDTKIGRCPRYKMSTIQNFINSKN